MVYIYVVQNLCTVVQTQPKRRVLDRADYTAPTRQHDLNHTDHADHTDHTDHTDQEFICPEDIPGTVDHLVGIECLSHARKCPMMEAIVIRTHSTHSNLYIPLFSRSMFGPDYYAPPCKEYRPSRSWSVLCAKT